MAMTDPIADLLTRIRNATTVRHDRTDVPASKMKLEVAKILKQEGFIRTFKVMEEGPQGTIRIYRGVDDLPKVQNGLGVAVISTNRGVLTDEQARGLRVGGEVLCEIW